MAGCATARSGRAPATRARCSASAATARCPTFFDAAELEVHAVAPAPNGGLYVATSPDGKIYQVVARRNGEDVLRSRRQVHLGARRRSNRDALCRHRRQGRHLQDHAGRPGHAFYKANATNVVSLAMHAERRADRRNRSARPRVQDRCDRQGVRAARFAVPRDPRHPRRRRRDDLRRGMSAGPVTPRRTPGRPHAATESARAAGSDGVDGDHRRHGHRGPDLAARYAGRGREPRRGVGRGAIYRIRPDGLWDTVWDTGDDAPYDLLIEPGGSLLVGTGPEGKIFRVTGDPARATLLARAARVRSPPFSANLPDASSARPAIPGKLFALVAVAGEARNLRVRRPRRRHGGELGRDPLARVGAPGPVQSVTRSGNTATPDETWSAWSKPYSNADGEQIASPNARYLQWRAAFTADTSTVAGADVGDGRLPAPQPSAGGLVDHRPSARDGLSASVLHRRDGDRGLRGQHVGRSPAQPDLRCCSDWAIVVTALARAREANLSEGSADDGVEGRGSNSAVS